MKKILKIIGIVIILALACFFSGMIIAYGYGFDAGKNSNNLDKVYANYLNDILPDDVNDTSLIVYERHYLSDDNYANNYYVYHNCNQTEYWKWAKNLDFYHEYTLSSFNDMGIFHREIAQVIYNVTITGCTGQDGKKNEEFYEYIIIQDNRIVAAKPKEI